MDIIINKEKINFTLENETCLGEVVNGIENWLNNSNLIITSMKFGNRELTIEPQEKWADVSLKKVARLYITAQLLKKLKISNLETVYSFLNMLSKGIDEENITLIDELLNNYTYLLQGLKSIFGNTTSTTTGQMISDIEKLLCGCTSSVILAWPKGVKDKAINLLHSLGQKVSYRLKEQQHPIDSLKDTVKDLKKSAIEIGDVSLLLQTGKDQKAMEYIIRFSELSEKILRLFSYLKDSGLVSIDNLKIESKTLEDFFNKLNEILKELTLAFTNKDSVLIGDLLEYEIVPHMELLINFINKIIEMKRSTIR